MPLTAVLTGIKISVFSYCSEIKITGMVKLIMYYFLQRRSKTFGDAVAKINDFFTIVTGCMKISGNFSKKEEG